MTVPTTGASTASWTTEHELEAAVPFSRQPNPALGPGPGRATGPIVSCYPRDPDQNLIELSNYAPR